MGCFMSKPVDPPPYKRRIEESRAEGAEHIGVICLVCGKQIKNDYVSIEAHYVYCDEEFQTPPEIKTWQKLDAMTEYERKQKGRFGDV